MGLVMCLFSNPGQTWPCPCTLCCQDSLQTLEIKVVFLYGCWGLLWGERLVLVQAEHRWLGKLSPDRASCEQSPSHSVR